MNHGKNVVVVVVVNSSTPEVSSAEGLTHTM